MGTQKESKKEIARFKKLIALAVLLVLFALPVFCEIAYNAGLLPQSPSGALLKAFGASANDNETELVEFFSVGQGDCTIIKSRDMAAVIDFGLPDESDMLYNRLRKLGIDKVDLAIVTHNDKDHLGGFADLIENISIDRLLINELSLYTEDATLYNEAIYLAENSGAVIFTPTVGGKYQIGDAVLEIIYSNPDAKNENDRSIALMLEIGGKRILFTGDLESDEEENMLSAAYDIDCDILKLGHHGSKTSTGYELLKRTTPTVAVASSGYDNTYGHPAEQVIERLEKFEIPLYRTDLDKTVRCTFENNAFKVTFEREGIE